jgi:hypothetical protein
MGTGLATAGQDGEEIFLERNTQTEIESELESGSISFGGRQKTPLQKKNGRRRRSERHPTQLRWLFIYRA